MPNVLDSFLLYILVIIIIIIIIIIVIIPVIITTIIIIITNTSSVSGIPHSGKPDGLLGVYDALRQQWQQPVQTGFHQTVVALQAGLDCIQCGMRHLEMWITCRSTCSN